MSTTLPAAPAPISVPLPRIFRLRTRWLWIVSLALLATALLVGALLVRARLQAAPSLVSVPLTRADLSQTVTASGTVNAQNTVTVGTQVSGTIQALYVDFNSRVNTGQVLARLDPGQIQAQLDQAEATLAQARAQAFAAGESATGAGFTVSAATATLASANAEVLRTKSALDLAHLTLARDKALLSQGYIAQSQADCRRGKRSCGRNGVPVRAGHCSAEHRTTVPNRRECPRIRWNGASGAGSDPGSTSDGRAR